MKNEASIANRVIQAADSEQRQEIRALAVALKEQATQLPKVREQIASRSPVARIAANND